MKERRVNPGLAGTWLALMRVIYTRIARGPRLHCGPHVILGFPNPHHKYQLDLHDYKNK